MIVDSPKADRITGLVLLALGIAMLVGGYTMDRLEIRQIHPASIPGLVPMGLGIAMIVCSLLLIASAQQKHQIEAQDESVQKQTGSYKNLLVTAGLCVGYAGGLLGKVPFMAATFCFIFVFSAFFMWPDKIATNRNIPKFLALLAVFALIFSGAISVLFQYGFLVRLP